MSTQPNQFEDSLIGDVRRARAKLLAECDNDIRKLARRLMAEQAEHAERVVNLRGQKTRPPRR